MSDFDGPWYVATIDVEHDGATFPAGTRVSWENPAVRAYPERFDRVMDDGSTVHQPLHDRPVPMEMMPDGSRRPLPVQTKAEAGPAIAEWSQPRSPGRPAWRRSLLRQRLAEAEAATPEPRTDAAIAERFRGLAADGSAGIDPHSLARLRRRAARGEMPE